MTEIRLVPQNPANGPVAAAVLSCAVGCFLLGLLAVAADGSKRLAATLNFYHPTGPLSGVTTVAIALWIVCWFVFLALGLLLTFPPFGDLFLGR
jgi:hypothetical protein